MRRSLMMVATSICLAVLVTVGGSGSAAFGASFHNTARSSAIPAGFRAQSSSWVSPTHGWLLGSAPCGVATCTTVAGTTDGGLTWNRLGTLDAPLSYQDKAAVTEVRYWLAADSGAATDIVATRPFGSNARDSLTWTAGTGFCDRTAARGAC